MRRAYVGIGSNVEPEAHLRSALQALRETFGELAVSPVYRSAAVGFEASDFFNLVIGFDSEEPVGALARRLRAIELVHDRRRDRPKFSSRTLDLDLLLYGDLVLEAGGLQLPRDDVTRYAFVLRPLAELAGDLRHPISGRTFADLWAAFDHRQPSLEPVDLAL